MNNKEGQCKCKRILKNVIQIFEMTPDAMGPYVLKASHCIPVRQPWTHPGSMNEHQLNIMRTKPFICFLQNSPMRSCGFPLKYTSPQEDTKKQLETCKGTFIAAPPASTQRLLAIAWPHEFWKSSWIITKFPPLAKLCDWLTNPLTNTHLFDI